MIHLISDSSTLFNQKEAEDLGFTTVPLNVIVDGQSYRDYEDISLDEFLEFCRQKKSVSSSQPSIGEKIETYNKILENPEDVILDITMANGLSGTYQSALMAKDSSSDPDRVYVFNSKTLCGPQRALVLKAMELIKQGLPIEEIIEKLEKSADSDVSTISVTDFDFLARGGRVGKGTAKVGDFFKLIPIAVKTKDGTTLEMKGFGRTFKKVLDMTKKEFDKNNVDNNYKIFITHADNEASAKKAEEYFEKAYPGVETEILPLCPMFAVHGGPGCVAIQAIKIED